MIIYMDYRIPRYITVGSHFDELEQKQKIQQHLQADDSHVIGLVRNPNLKNHQ